jgi:Bacterial capsule synthesis protein PGA_cap
MRSPISIFALLLLVLPASSHAEEGFSRACEKGETLTIAATGDVLLHGPLQKQAYSQGFQTLWRAVKPLLAEADMVYGNLEGPTASGVTRGGSQGRDPGLVFDNNVYTGYPMFNYNPQLERELVQAGFTVVSTANNHAMDRGPLGADKTIEALRAAGLPYTGTHNREEVASGKRSWSVVTEKNGWKVAWIACAFGTNGLPDPNHQVLNCFRDAALIENELRELSANPAIDASIVTPHWGEVEYTQKIENSQRDLARRFAEAGATAILGNHPHVTKPWEKIATHDGRETFVIYSIGNFISAQPSLATKTSAIVYLGLTKAHGQKAWVNGMAYVPTYMLWAPFTVIPSDSDPRVPSASADLLARLLGHEGMANSRERVVTNPQCR